MISVVFGNYTIAFIGVIAAVVYLLSTMYIDNVRNFNNVINPILSKLHDIQVEGDELMRKKRKNQELESKLLEYRQWARTYGGCHSSSTVPKQIRTIRRFGEICDMLSPKGNMEFILDELVRESDRGVKPQTINHVIYDIEAWARFLGQPMTIPRFKQAARAEPWIPKYEDVQKIRKTASRYKDRAIASRNRCIVDVLFAEGVKIWELIKLNLSNLDGRCLPSQVKRERLKG